ncbi:hypothetical protein IFM89_032246 [Coptis chinensis]|uniref:F-box domain-containing protein n=1 Tax=Coptis chinensis TaxID=261450 RepID=A0A835IHU1_9MAGN|nr:hypothetical protein IFM89_032246 [Coptis chinensis]
MLEKVYQLFYPNSFTGRQLPDEIIVDIFGRLPAECIVRCGHACKPSHALMRSPAFVYKHLNRATPVIAFSYHGKSYRNPEIPEVNVHFTDGLARTISLKRVPLEEYSLPVLFGSYNGFLLFRGSKEVFIWNPISELVGVTLPLGSCLCGFFIYPRTMEYRIIHQSRERNYFKFFVYGLMSKESKEITFSHPPTTEKAPILLHGVLHWMVSDDAYQIVHGVQPDCSNSIVLFNINSEDFYTTPHPGVQCGLKKKHGKMELIEMEGHLCFCDSSSNENVVIWILEDYEDMIWRKRFIVMMEFCGIQWRYGYNVNVGGFQIYNKELLVRVSKNDIILYDLQTGVCRRVGNRVKNDSHVVAVPHINSLVLDID